MSTEAVTETLPGRRVLVQVVRAATAVLLAWFAARVVGLDRLPVADRITVPLITLTPYAAAAALIPLPAAALLRGWRAAAAAGLTVLLAAAVLLPRMTADGATAAKGPRLRVLTANLYFGQASASELVRLVRTERVDVLSLQEFTPDARNALASEGLRILLPYEVADPRWGPAGSGLYSRYPLTFLPALPGTFMAHPRASLELDGRQIELTAVHPLPPIDGQGLADWKHSLSTLPPATANGPIQILAGDFNSSLDHARFRDLLARGRYTDAADRRGEGLIPTWGSFPRFTLDHILVPRTVAVLSYSVPPLSGTDHHPVLAELQLP